MVSIEDAVRGLAVLTAFLTQVLVRLGLVAWGRPFEVVRGLHRQSVHFLIDSCRELSSLGVCMRV